MNTINSVYYGWGFLICAGAGSYYFAKRSINADRAQRQALENQRRQQSNRKLAESRETTEMPFKQPATSGVPGAASSIGPSLHGKASAKDFPRPQDPNGKPSKDAQASTSTKLAEGSSQGSRWEASKPYRSPKGDRFS